MDCNSIVTLGLHQNKLLGTQLKFLRNKIRSNNIPNGQYTGRKGLSRRLLKKISKCKKNIMRKKRRKRGHYL